MVNDPCQILTNGRSLDEINRIDYSAWSGLQFQHFEMELQKELNYLLVKAKPGKIVDYSSVLLKNWSDEGFCDLLNCLAVEHRDTDVFLALIAASRREKPEPIILSHGVYTSMLNGLMVFAGNSQASNLIGQVLPNFVNSYLLEEQRSNHELCILGLAAHYGASYHLPEGLLWQIAPEWPIAAMPGWGKLWQCAVMQVACPIYTDHKQTELREKLAQLRAKADADFARDGAHFIRLGSLQSHRHLNLMTRLLQNLAEKLEVLKNQDGLLAKAKPEQLQDLIVNLANLLRDDVDESLSEGGLREMYEAGIRADKIDDSNPFHQRISLRILKECAHSVNNRRSLVGTLGSYY
jgi:hypothetical protein